MEHVETGDHNAQICSAWQRVRAGDRGTPVDRALAGLCLLIMRARQKLYGHNLLDVWRSDCAMWLRAGVFSMTQGGRHVISVHSERTWGLFAMLRPMLGHMAPDMHAVSTFVWLHAWMALQYGNGGAAWYRIGSLLSRATVEHPANIVRDGTRFVAVRALKAGERLFYDDFHASTSVRAEPQTHSKTGECSASSRLERNPPLTEPLQNYPVQV